MALSYLLLQRFDIESHTVINSDRIAAADDHLSRMIGNRPIYGLAELVWNAVDANADKIDIRIETTVTGAVDRVIVTDDGHGFAVDEIRSLFGHVGGSWKHTAPHRKTRGGKRLLHGDKGEGRWKAFSIGDRITWSSVTRSDDGPNVATTLKMSANRLAEYEWSEPEPTDTKTGTTVVVDVGTKEPNSLLGSQARQTLTSIMALYLTKYPTVEIFYDGDKLTVDRLIADKAELDVDYENEYGPVQVTVLEWNEKIERALFLCDENGATLHEDAPRIHAPGVVFTAYVRWAGFRVNESLLPLADFGNDEIGPALEAAREALRSYFRDKSANDTKTVVQEWVDEEVYPFREEATDAVQMAEQALFNFVAVSAADAVNRIEDRTAKALSLETMRVAVERDPGSVEYIMQEVLRLPESKVHEFRALLEQTSLTAILDAMHLVTGRLRFIGALEALLFDPEHAPEVLERAHLHKMLEEAPWIFGEEFATHVSDSGLTALLSSHLELLGRREFVSEPVTDLDGKSRRIDFLFGRALELNRQRREHLVVEIKRPGLSIGRTEMDQIEDYAHAVSSDGRFDLGTVEWDFVLVATNLKEIAEHRASQPNRPRGLLFESDDGVRIWVKSWAEIIGSCKHRLKFIRDKLQYDPDADDAVQYLRDTYPDYIPDHMKSD